MDFLYTLIPVIYISYISRREEIKREIDAMGGGV